MNRFTIRAKPPTWATHGLALTIIFGVAFFLRVYFPYDNVFTGDWVRFQSNDPWYHMRAVENLVYHFPHRFSLDPYGFYPYGLSGGTAPFFDLILGFIIWVLGAGSPSRALIESVGAYFPAILGALVTIPVYFIGKELFNKSVGLLAAGLIAIMPGLFLNRTLLGFTDHHSAEIMFSTLCILFLILALKSSKQKGISFNSLRRRGWGTLRKPLIYSLLAGIALGFYLLSWNGGGIIIIVIFVFAVLQYISDHLRGRSTDYLCLIGVPAFLVALLMVIPASAQYSLGSLQVSSLLIGILGFLALSGLSLLLVNRNMRRVYYPLALVALGGIGLAFFHLIDPTLLNSMVDRLNSIFRPTAESRTIAEMVGLSVPRAWQEFTTGFYLSLISLVIIAYLAIKDGAAQKTLLLVWSMTMLMATVGLVRFAYYFAVNVALLTAYLSWRILEFAGLEEATEEVKGEGFDKSMILSNERKKSRPSKKAKRSKQKAKEKRQEALVARFTSSRYAYGLIALIVVFFLAFYPNIGKSIEWASALRGPSEDWHATLVWMEENTTDPFGDDDFYYQLYGEGYDYAEPEYGVLSWWDYGYWITYIAHRIPNAHPGGGSRRSAGLFFTAQDESSANEVINGLSSKYVIIDIKMAREKFYSMIEWAEKDVDDFYEWYFIRISSGNLEPLKIYYPAYYRSMCSRLYNFEGRAIVPGNSTWVISYDERIDAEGNRYKEITDVANNGEPFTTYEEAEEYLELYGSSKHRIVGMKPLISPVPLEELKYYKLIYRSPTEVGIQGEQTVSEVEVFEYLPQDRMSIEPRAERLDSN